VWTVRWNRSISVTLTVSFAGNINRSALLRCRLYSLRGRRVFVPSRFTFSVHTRCLKIPNTAVYLRTSWHESHFKRACIAWINITTKVAFGIIVRDRDKNGGNGETKRWPQWHAKTLFQNLGTTRFSIFPFKGEWDDRKRSYINVTISEFAVSTPKVSPPPPVEIFWKVYSFSLLFSLSS